MCVKLISACGGLFFQALCLSFTQRPTKRAPDAGDSGENLRHFSRLIIFLAGRLRRPRPSAGNANRWAASQKIQNPLLGKSLVIK